MRTQGLLRGVILAAAAIAAGALVTTGPAAAQWKADEVAPESIDQIGASIKRPGDGWRAANFYRGEYQVAGPNLIYPIAWVDNQNANPSGLRYYREIGRSTNSLTVRSSDDKETLVFNFKDKKISGTSDGKPISGDIATITTWFCPPSGSAAPPRFSNFGSCVCELGKLLPLQGAVGLGEVAKKTKDISEDINKETADLRASPIKIVQGTGGNLFITDHHHGALAWKNAGYAMGLCVRQDTLDTEQSKFAEEIEKKKLVRLRDENGNVIAWANLPKTLGDLGSHNDPYRTLAWMVRKADANGFNSDKTPKFKPGYCRAYITGGTDFSEFAWADALRKQASLPVTTVTAATNPALWDGKKKDRLTLQVPVLTAALAFAASDAAKDLPGWRGTKQYQGKDVCPPDPVE